MQGKETQLGQLQGKHCIQAKCMLMHFNLDFGPTQINCKQWTKDCKNLKPVKVHESFLNIIACIHVQVYFQ